MIAIGAYFRGIGESLIQSKNAGLSYAHEINLRRGNSDGEQLQLWKFAAT